MPPNAHPFSQGSFTCYFTRSLVVGFSLVCLQPWLFPEIAYADSSAISPNFTEESPPLTSGGKNAGQDADAKHQGEGSTPLETWLRRPCEVSQSQTSEAKWLSLRIIVSYFDSFIHILGWQLPRGLNTGARIDRLACEARTALGSPALLPRILSNLSILYKVQGRSQKAIYLQERALEIAQGADNPNHYRIGLIASRLALLYEETPRIGDAETYFNRAIAAFEKAGDAAKSAQAHTLHDLAIFYGRRNRYREGGEAALRSLSMLSKDDPLDQNSIFDVLNMLGGTYRAQGRYEEAESFALRAFGIAHTQFKSPDERLSRAAANLAVIYKDEEHYIEAITLFHLALGEAEAAPGPDDVWSGMIANRLAVTYLELGRTSEAELFFSRALSVAEKNADEEPLFLSATLFNLSSVYVRQLRYQEAEALLNHSLMIRLKIHGPSHPAVIEVEDAMRAVQRALGQKSQRLSAGTIERPGR